MNGETIEQVIYGGKIKIKFVEGNHSYYISHKIKTGWTPYERTTGVTTFIGIKDKSGPLKYWVARIMHTFLHLIIKSGREITRYDLDEAKVLHAKRLEEASTIGTKIHDWIELYVKGKQPQMPQEAPVLTGVNAFLDWMKKNKIKIIESELVLYSKEHNYCGKLDAIIQIGKKKYLLDFKTSTGVYNEVMLQTAAYVQAYEEMGLGKLDGRWECRLEKRSPEEFAAEMDEKGKVNAEYRPFEAIFLDHVEGQLEADIKGFLAAKDLKEWDTKAQKSLELCIEKSH